MENKFIPKAIEIVKEAVKADNEGELEKALDLYISSIDHFVTGLKYEKNARTKQAIKQKVNSYVNRAEQIREHLDKKREKEENSKKKAVTPGADEDDGKDPEKAKLAGALMSAIVQEKPNVKWDDVAGLETAKGLLKEAVILPVKFPQLFTGKRKPWKGILLYGPPGTGKSYLAKAVATESGASTFLSVSSSDLVSKYQGESERLVKQLFEMAREHAPSIVFIDEIDSLCSNRGDGENESARRIKTEFLVQMQGVGKENAGVLVLGATNTPWELDPAIRRRFEKRVYIGLPEDHARGVIFKVHIGQTPSNLQDEDYETLAHLTNGFSGSDIAVVVRDALYEPVRTCQFATHFRKVPDPERKQPFLWEPCAPSARGASEMSLMDVESSQLKPLDVTMNDFRRVLANARATVGPEDLIRIAEWTNQYGQEGS